MGNGARVGVELHLRISWIHLNGVVPICHVWGHVEVTKMALGDAANSAKRSIRPFISTIDGSNLGRPIEDIDLYAFIFNLSCLYQNERHNATWY